MKMRRKKGFEMSINVLVYIIIGVIVLAGLVFMFSGGWKNFMDVINNYRGSDFDNAEKLCLSQCQLDNKHSFCCEEKLVAKEKIFCNNPKLKVDCPINCEGVCS